MHAASPLVRRHHSQPSGFTLIELLVVVAILSAASLLAFGILADDRTQMRYDDTRNRLGVLRYGVLGHFFGSTAAIGGFVADNGDLPSDIATLMQTGSLLAQSAQTPVFDPQPNATTCANNGSEMTDPFGTTPDVNALLIKGHRGDYLGGMGFNGYFRDGWGNVDPTAAVDTLNAGWSVALNSSERSLTFTSLGLDNESDGTGFAADVSHKIVAADWLVPLQGWSITLNKRYVPSADTTIKLSASLLVFRNTPSGGQWLRYSTPLVSVCFDGDGDDMVASLPCAKTETLSFSATCNPDNTASAPAAIPQGRHLLVLTAHPTAMWQADDTPYWRTGQQATSRIDAAAGTPLPAVSLELR